MRTLGLSCVVLVGCSSDPVPRIDCTVPASDGTPAPLQAPTVAACDTNGWCWEHPLPFIGAIGAVWHRRDQTILGGANGYMLRARDGVWEAMPTLPRPPGLTGATQTNEIWADGDLILVAGAVGITGVVWTYGGTDWTTHVFVDGYVPHYIWGTSAQRIMTVGAEGAELYNGSTWAATDAAGARGQGLWGCHDEFFAGFVGGTAVDRTIGRFGTGWSSSGDVPTTNVQFSALSGTANDDVFVSGIVNGTSQNVAWHFDGTRWTDLQLPDAVALVEIAAIGRGQALAAGTGTDGRSRVWRYDGAWTIETDVLAPQHLSVAAADDVIGSGGLDVVQYDGQGWTSPFQIPVASPLSSKAFVGIWSGAQSVLAIATDGTIVQRAGATWTPMTTPNPNFRALRAIWGSSDQDVWVVGQRALLWHYDGATWSEVAVPATAAGNDLAALWGTTSSDVFAVGAFGTILHFDGAMWTRETGGGTGSLIGIWGASSADIWAIGSQGQLVHWNGTIWDDSSSLPGTFSGVTGIWGSGPSQIFISAAAGVVWAFDGNAWAKQQLPTTGDFSAVWGRSSGDVYVVGAGAFHFNGAAWTDIQPAGAFGLSAIWGDAAQTRVVGGVGVIMTRPE